MCLHEKTIDSYPACEVVCLNCGEVLHQILDHSITSPFITDEFDDFLIRDEIDNLIHNLNLPAGLKDEMCKEYREHRINKELSTFKNNELICFTVYDNLIKNKAPRLLEEICWRCHVNPSRVWLIQKSLRYFNELDPITLIDRVLDELNISYGNKPEIIETVRKLEEVSVCKPETIVACAVHIHTGQKTDILKSICDVCHISKSSVLSLFKRSNRRYGWKTAKEVSMSDV